MAAGTLSALRAGPRRKGAWSATALPGPIRHPSSRDSNPHQRIIPPLLSIHRSRTPFSQSQEAECGVGAGPPRNKYDRR